jgi:hypothetical protein
MSFGFGFALPHWQTLSGGAFSPASLFSAGEQGAWYDPSDLTTLFQDSAGGTPVTAVEQPVGRMLDKSGRGNHATQSTSTSRPVLRARYNLLLNSATLSTQNVTTQATNYTLRFEGTGSVVLSGTGSGTFTTGVNTFTATAGTLTLTVTGTVSNADLRPTSQANGFVGPLYQAITTATSYDSSGFLPYLAFDGTDDSLLTNSVDFTATGKMTVWAGVRKLSDAAQGVVSELSATIASNNGSFLLTAPNSAAANYNWSSKGTTQVNNTVTTYTAPITNVVTGIADIAGASNIIRINGVQVGSVATTQGTGNYGNYPLYIGRRNNATLPLNGNIYSLIIRGAQSSDAQISSTESWVEIKTFGKDMQNVYSDPVLTASLDQVTTANGEDVFMTVTYQ